MILSTVLRDQLTDLIRTCEDIIQLCDNRPTSETLNRLGRDYRILGRFPHKKEEVSVAEMRRGAVRRLELAKKRLEEHEAAVQANPPKVVEYVEVTNEETL